MVLKLHYTPRSHFSRKVRILLAAMALPCELLDAGNVAAMAPALFGPNPLLKVPTLIDGEQAIFESDHIAQYLTRRYAPDDPFAVLSTDPALLNARAVMNGIMATEVELILAERSGIDIKAQVRFDKMRAAIAQGLVWLEDRSAMLPEPPSYPGFHLVAMWDHLRLYGLVPMDYPALAAKVARLSALAFVAESEPR